MTNRYQNTHPDKALELTLPGLTATVVPGAFVEIQAKWHDTLVARGTTEWLKLAPPAKAAAEKSEEPAAKAEKPAAPSKKS